MDLKERNYIRDLARRKLELANTPYMQNLVKEWTAHNDLRGSRPMIHFEMGTVGDRGFHYECRCTSDDARHIEWVLGESMQNHFMVGDDRPVTGDFYVGYGSWMKLFDLNPSRTNTDGVGFHINAVIENLDSLDQIKPSPMGFDEGSLGRSQEYYGDILGDILDIRGGMGSIGISPTNNLVQLMTMENMFTEIYDNPDNFHEMMNRLTNDYITYMNELERRGTLLPCRGNNWGYMDSQETVGVSPAMFKEFFYPYYKRMSEKFGLLSYGCCEQVHAYWKDSLSKFENLRKILISPWCDEEYMGDQLRGSKVIYHRKPSPLDIGGTEYDLDEEGFREHIRTTMRAAKGCKLEITFRDTYTLKGNPGKPRSAVEIVREEIENTWSRQ
ncbi:MAG: uroporphyrinogen decarboxylase family protein [Eubacteriales bacterium]|nr:uroporphyrinogen decarboxylase family protein [Eubacteriales bacterium]